MSRKIVLTDLNILGGAEYARETCEAAGFDLIFADTREEEDLAQAVKDAEGVLVQFAPITRRLIQSMDRCKVISRYGIGLDNVDTAAASEQGIEVLRLPDYCWNEVADHALTLLLTINRKILQFDRSIRNGRWGGPPGDHIRALNNSVLGIIGFGNVGRLVAKRALCFGMTVIAYDPYANKEGVAGVEVIDDLDQLLQRSDYVSLHCPLTTDTFHIIDSERLKVFKRGAGLINTSRGALVKTEDIVAALKEGLLGAAALDVFEEEPLGREHPLFSFDNVVLTPHVAWCSLESFERLQRKPVLNLIDYLAQAKSQVSGEFPS